MLDLTFLGIILALGRGNDQAEYESGDCADEAGAQPHDISRIVVEMVPGQGATEQHPEERAAKDNRERDQRHCQGAHGLPSSYNRAFDMFGSPPKNEPAYAGARCAREFAATTEGPVEI